MGISKFTRLGTVAALGLGLLTSVVLAPDASGAASFSCADASVGTPGDDQDSNQDIDADGNSDLVTGVPDAGAGVIDIHYAADTITGHRTASPRVTIQRIGQAFFAGLPAPQAGDEFGASVAISDFDDDHCEDLAIGVPGADGGRGAVILAFGSVDGVNPANAKWIPGHSAGEHFGAAIAALGRDIWIGAPDHRVGDARAAGAVYHYKMSQYRARLLDTISEATPGVPRTAEPNDHFGAVLGADDVYRKVAVRFHAVEPTLVVGVPDKDVGSAKDAGAVTELYFLNETNHFQRAHAFDQNSPGVGGVAAAGNRFGASVSIAGSLVAVGVPGQDVGDAHDAGRVQLLDVGLKTVHQVAAFTQNSSGIPGRAERGDELGSAVLLLGCADPTSDSGGSAMCLAAGAPGEDIGTATNAGVVDEVVLKSHDGSYVLRDPVALHQGPSGPYSLGGHAERGDHAGRGLAAVNRPSGEDDGGDNEFGGGAELVVAVPGEDVGPAHDAGVVVLTGHPDAPSANEVVTIHDSAGPQAGQHYGVGAQTRQDGGQILVAS